MVYCTHCGKEQLEPISLNCPFCGKQNLVNSISDQIVQIKQQLAEYGYKNPGTAAFLGLVIPGLGHVYDGNVGFGILLFVIGVIIAYVGGIAVLIVSIGSAWAAHDEANRINASINRLVNQN